MSLRIGINGFGRIGRMVFRFISETSDIEVVHINDVMRPEMMAHLLRYDSIHGRFNADVAHDNNYLVVNGRETIVTSGPNPGEIPWKDIDIVVDSSGRFTTREQLQGHIAHGAKRVILSCPPSSEDNMKCVVMGVNHTEAGINDSIISNASCTSNCVALLVKVLKDEFGMKRAFMNTVHPMTNSQNIQDAWHSDPRRARSAAMNLIPTTTSAVKCVRMIFPGLKEYFTGMAVRVPVTDCSLVELTAQLNRNVSIPEINNAFLSHANGDMAGYLQYCTDPIVSSDILNSRYSAVFDSLLTEVVGGDLVRIIAWYDNETGYSARIVDLIKHLSRWIS